MARNLFSIQSQVSRQEGGSCINISDLTRIRIARSKLRLAFRILVPFVAFFLMPRLVGAEVYASFVLQFFFFTSAIGLVTSPIEHALIRLRSRPGYGPKFVQLFWANAMIVTAACVLGGVIYYQLFESFQPLFGIGILVLPAVATAAATSQIGIFLKFYRVDWYYYYAEILGYMLIATLSILATFWRELNLITFSCVSALVYMTVCVMRLWQMSQEGSIERPRLRRIKSLLLRAVIATSLSSLLGALVKRADSFYMPALGSPPSTVLVYRLIRNTIAVAPLVGSLYAQDVWMNRSKPRHDLSFIVYLVATISLLLILCVVVWLYLEWLGIPNPLQFYDVGCIGLATMAVVFLSLNAVEINRVFQAARYSIVLAGSLLAFISSLGLFALGRLANFEFITYLLVIVFIPQFTNGLYVKVRMRV